LSEQTRKEITMKMNVKHDHCICIQGGERKKREQKLGERWVESGKEIIARDVGIIAPHAA
jgi:hypothetical protein